MQRNGVTGVLGSRESAELAYENLDQMRDVDVFLKCMPGASVLLLRLTDLKPVYLAANTCTLYFIPGLKMKETGMLD